MRVDSYDPSKILSIFPLAPGLWELTVQQSYTNRLKGNAQSHGYTVLEGYHPGKPPNYHLDSNDALIESVVAIEKLVARAAVICVIPEQKSGTHPSAASIYRKLMDLYRC